MLFASEVKALLAYPGVNAEIDPVALDQIFTYWSPLPGASAFRGIREVPPGHFLTHSAGETAVKRYWDLTFTALIKALPPGEFREIVAASNFKQRTRMAMLYYHAELNNYAVAGTANKNEQDMGFFVKYGDGGVDVKPIEHLYKTQVYQLAEFLDVPENIRSRTPTTDTYSAPTTQQDFFFRLPFETMDLLWYAKENQVPAAEAGRVMNLSEEQVMRAYNDFARKRRTTKYLRLQPIGLSTSDARAAASS